MTGLLACGCMSVYQPVSGLHRPVAIDTAVANFPGVAFDIQCLPAKHVVTEAEAEDMCRKLTQLFENQGARVETRITPGRIPELEDEVAEEAAPDEGPVTTKLSVRLSSRLLHKDVVNILWWKITTDYIFAQDIVIRDASGFLLVQETLTGRFIRRLGFSRGANLHFSKDYYGQLSQLAFNARMRRTVLDEVRPAAAAK